MGGRDEQEFQQRIARIETLVQQVETIPDPVARAGVEELIQALLALHGAGIERVLEHIDGTGAAGEHILQRLVGDELVGSLLLLHGLHPYDFETRVRQALDKVRPYMQSHKGNVELLSAADGFVRLRLQGSCHGCPSSEMTLKLAIEEALYAAAPDMVDLHVEGVVETPIRSSSAVIPLTVLRADSRPEAANGHGHGWQAVDGLESLGTGSVRTLAVDGQPIVFCRVGETYYAYANHCPHCEQGMAGARLDGPALACPTCGHHYDVQRAGRGHEQPSEHLEPFPLLLEHGQLRIALPALQG